MSETPELPPLPERATPTWTAYGRGCWDAGRRAGLEEAAKLVIEGDRQGGRRGWNQAVQFFAERIRAKAGECGGTGRAKP